MKNPIQLLCLCVILCLSLTKAQSQPNKKPSKLGAAFEFVFDFVRNTHSSNVKGANEETRGLQVIGAGFARSGTKSTEEALKRLHHKVYDTRSMMELNHVPQWIAAAKAYKERDSLVEMETILKQVEELGFTATLDFPMNLMAPYLAELRPQAKVLMTVRDTEEKWVEAWIYINDVLGHFVCRPWIWLIGDLQFPSQLLDILEDFDFHHAQYPDDIDRPLPWFEIYRGNRDLDTEPERAKWIDLHKRFQKRLEESLPSEHFLVYNVKQGWRPLLEFLEIQDPHLGQEEFPYVNDRKSLETVRLVMDVLAAGAPLWIALFVYAIYRMLSLVGRRSKKTKVP